MTVTGPADEMLRRGHYAGIVTRLAAFLVDVVVVGASFALGGSVLDYLLSRLTGNDVSLSDAPVVAAVALAAWSFVYAAYCLAAAGHTPGMAVFGVRAVEAGGGDLTARRAVLRVLVFPLSFLVFGFGFLMILLRRDRRALHDVLARTAVVYSWDARARRPGFLTRDSRHAER